MQENATNLTRREERSLGYDTPMGLCEIQNANNRKPPTLDGWERRINTYKPSSVRAVNVLWGRGPLCRCENKDDSIYYTAYHYSSEYYMVNGVYVIPTSSCPSEDNREAYLGDLFFC